MSPIKDRIKSDRRRLRQIEGDPDIARAEKLLKLSMLQAKIRVQNSLYGINLAKTIALVGAGASAILNLLGIKFKETSISFSDLGEGMQKAAADSGAAAVGQSLTMGQSMANHAYLLFIGIIVAIIVYEKLKKKDKEEKDEEE